MYVIAYSAADGEDTENLTVRCKLYIDGVLDGYLEQQSDGTFSLTPEVGKTYRVVLEAVNDTGMTVYEMVVGV